MYDQLRWQTDAQKTQAQQDYLDTQSAAQASLKNAQLQGDLAGAEAANQLASTLGGGANVFGSQSGLAAYMATKANPMASRIASANQYNQLMQQAGAMRSGQINQANQGLVSGNRDLFSNIELPEQMRNKKATIGDFAGNILGGVLGGIAGGMEGDKEGKGFNVSKAIGGFLPFLSTKTAKTHIRKADTKESLRKVLEVGSKLKKFEYKPGLDPEGQTGRTRTGMISEENLEYATNDGKGISKTGFYELLSNLAGSVKELDDKIRRIDHANGSV